MTIIAIQKFLFYIQVKYGGMYISKLNKLSGTSSIFILKNYIIIRNYKS